MTSTGPPPETVVHDVCGSTSDLARALAERGATSGTAVVARRQTAGRGRRGRVWTSLPGEHLFLSMIHRSALPTDAIAGLTLDVGLAVLQALGCEALGLKWPNDLIAETREAVGERKVGGVLCELVEASPAVVIIGIGVNIDTQGGALPPGLADQATTLRAVLGANTPSVEAVSAAVIAGVRAALVAFEGRGGPDTPAVAARCRTLGRRVRHDTLGLGRAQGIAADGALRVIFDNETTPREVRSGGVVHTTEGPCEPGLG